jgi:hypothetical protein
LIVRFLELGPAQAAVPAELYQKQRWSHVE